jgi:hypothetical protein
LHHRAMDPIVATDMIQAPVQGSMSSMLNRYLDVHFGVD